MVNLGEIGHIGQNINNAKEKAIQALHTVIFGREGRLQIVRESVRKFSGFNLDIESEAYMERISRVKGDLLINDMIAVCHILDLDYSGSHDDIVRRVCLFLNILNAESENDSENERNEEENVDNESDGYEDCDNSVKNFRNQAHAPARPKKKESFALTFRDVEDSIRVFNGKDDYPINKWILDFEEMANITGWNDLQKLIFAKKSLSGLAKLFIQSEKGIKSWSVLKKKLTDEFEVKINSVQIHKLLMS